MIQIPIKIECLLKHVKQIFVNHLYQYTCLVLASDNHLMLYDMNTCSVFGITKHPYLQQLSTVCFTSDFNQFFSFTNKCNNYISLIFFSLDINGLITFRLKPIVWKESIIATQVLSLCYLAADLQIQQKDLIIMISQSHIFFIEYQSGIVSSQIRLDQQNLVSAHHLSGYHWLIRTQVDLIFVNITRDKLIIMNRIAFKNQLKNVFVQNNPQGSFVGLTTVENKVFIGVKVDNDSWNLSIAFTYVNLNVEKLCFMIPGVNTSSINKYQNRIYLIIEGHVIPDQTRPKKQTNRSRSNSRMLDDQEDIVKCFITKKQLSDTTFYIHQYNINYIRNDNTLGKIKPIHQYFFQTSIKVKRHMWTNQINQNCLQILDGENRVYSINLIRLIQEPMIGQQWVALCYLFEGGKNNILYQQKQCQYEQFQKMPMTADDLNDWSYSIFPRSSFISHSIKRPKLHLFDND